MGRFKCLVDTPAAMEAFRPKYCIPQGVVLEYCPPERVLTNREPTAQPLPQDNPEVAARVGEETESSRLSLEEEIDEFYFEEDIPKAPLIKLSDVEGEQDRNSVIGAPLVIACSDDSLDEEVDNMASNKGKSLRELMASQGKGQSSKVPTKSQTSVLPPAAPQIPADLGLKVNPNLKKKRPVESLEEGEITQQVFVADEWCRDNRKLADVEAFSRAEVEKALRVLKQEHYELSEKLKEAESGRKSVEAGLKTKDKEEAQVAKEEAQLVKEAAEAEKRAAYQLGVEETKARLSEELPEVCRDYCSISWAQALNAAGIPADSALRLSENVAVQVEDVEEEKGKGKGKGKKTSSRAKDLTKETITKAEDHGAGPKVKDVPPPQPEQKENPLAEA
ncbi:uncharacterized protein LOC126690045 [Quercus robur]|uniref:uncharacterized protein LOC126690045 n=1 Tax=Quercus robur TaxID=38942 RepID=UPI002162CB2B|nr:uncharacterized protein LOC126690045 [Quercus robur]